MTVNAPTDIFQQFENKMILSLNRGARTFARAREESEIMRESWIAKLYRTVLRERPQF